ncbi:tetratricopeptide repeat protein [Neptunicella sp.]|uniref:tetratricopeptide repeat protein n=1 Tax=Neptunicella sp. TaxID=2125986 RepID=UPI003F68BC72
MRTKLTFAILLWGCMCSVVLAGQSGVCRKVIYGPDQYGPIDYFDPANHALGAGGRKKENSVTIVTNYHFTNDIKILKKGRTSIQLAGDLDYTLRAIPNNVDALDTASRFENKRSTSEYYAKKQKALPYTADCYFQRAISIFGGKQPELWMVWAIHKHRQGEYPKALEYYQESIKQGMEGAELEYNMGLTYFKLKDYENAQKRAASAYKMGFQLPGLKNMLNEVGYPIK